MKQTAVEWLADNIMPMISFHTLEYRNNFIKFIEQAKAMEKEYLERFYNQGYTQCSIEDLKPTSRDRYEDAEDYYNKIFKSE